MIKQDKCKLHKQEGYCLDCISNKFGEQVRKFVEKGQLRDVMRWACHADGTTIQEVMKGVIRR